LALIGADALHRRLKALQAVPKRLQQGWAVRTVPIMRSYIQVRTGRTRASLRPSGRGILGSPVVNFLDAGTVAHDEPRSRFTKTGRLRRGKAAGTGKVLKFNVGGRTLFRRKIHHPQTRGQHFKRPAAKRGLDESGLGIIVKQWNDAA
jgi:hypothetical protein